MIPTVEPIRHRSESPLALWVGLADFRKPVRHKETHVRIDGIPMNIEKLRVKNFKRFTDLEIDLSSCQAPPKLVLLIGANGSGKSSVFDAFEYISAPHKRGIRDHYVDYWEKIVVPSRQFRSTWAAALP